MAECVVCSKKITYTDLYSLKEGKICNLCASEYLGYTWEQLSKASQVRTIQGQLKNLSKEDVFDRIQETRKTKLVKGDFTPTEIGSKIVIDEPNKKWCYMVSGFEKFGLQKKEVFEYSSSFSFNEIKGFEILQNNSVISSGGMGSAVVGGILFGGIGAIVGSNIGNKSSVNRIESMKLKIVLDTISNPLLLIEYINSPVLSNSPEYEAIISNIQKDAAILEIILSDLTKQELPQSSSNSHLDKLTELKKIYDLGLITEDEYSKKKKEILDKI